MRFSAAHRPFGNACDMLLQAGEIGQFVDAFLADHGGIHVGQKKLLASGRFRLHHNVDRIVAAGLPQPLGDQARFLVACKGNIGGDLVMQPGGLGRGRQDGARCIDRRAVERPGRSGWKSA